MTFEGRGPCGSAFIVDILTDNKKRTLQVGKIDCTSHDDDRCLILQVIRHTFSSHNGEILVCEPSHLEHYPCVRAVACADSRGDGVGVHVARQGDSY